MKRLAFCLSVFLCLGLPFAAQGAVRSSFDLDPTTGLSEIRGGHKPQPIATPAPRTGGRTIGYTTSLVVPHGSLFTTLLDATAALTSDGFSIVPINRLAPSDLAGIDILVLGVIKSGCKLDDLQETQLLDYVLDGGSLYVLGENNTFFKTPNESVGDLFGLTYPDVDPPEVILTEIKPHPITLGPFGQVGDLVGTANAPTFFGSISSPGPFGTNLVEFPNGFASVVVIEPGALAPGSGLVLFFSEYNTFLENYFDSTNSCLWRNAFAYQPISLHFETEDDFATDLVNGQSISSPAQFGELVQIDGSGLNNFGACAFDSSPLGPNAFSTDPDLLVNRGNVLILQEGQGQTTPGIFDFPDDAQLGGILAFQFTDLVAPVSIDLIDLCPGPPSQDAFVTLFDLAGRTRLFTIPGGWTTDLFATGGTGFNKLNLHSLEPQPGASATATATETTGFDISNVQRLEVFLSSSGAVDNLVFTN